MKSGSSGSADESVVALSSPLADSESSAAGLRRADGQARGGVGGCHVAPTPSIDLELGPPLSHWACGVEGSPAAASSASRPVPAGWSAVGGRQAVLEACSGPRRGSLRSEPSGTGTISGSSAGRRTRVDYFRID